MKSLFASIVHHIGEAKRCIAIVGSGGKTSLMIGLANEYAKRGERVLLSTTTKLQKPENRAYDCHRYFHDDAILETVHHPGEKIFYALDGEEKALAPPIDRLALLAERFSVSLLEADGARGMDLKLHSERDPVIPPSPPPPSRSSPSPHWEGRPLRSALAATIDRSSTKRGLRRISAGAMDR